MKKTIQLDFKEKLFGNAASVNTKEYIDGLGDHC